MGSRAGDSYSLVRVVSAFRRTLLKFGLRAMANQRTDSKGGTVKVTLLKSPIGFNHNQWRVVTSLGLRRIRHTVELKDTPSTRGMIHKVRHLVDVTE
jgi:large subunit ribosomal protein L30